MPFLKEGRLETVPGVEGVGFMSRHYLLHWFEDHAQLEIGKKEKIRKNHNYFFGDLRQKKCGDIKLPNRKREGGASKNNKNSFNNKNFYFQLKGFTLVVRNKITRSQIN